MNEEVFLKNIKLPTKTYFLRTFPFIQLEKQLNSNQKKILLEQIFSRGIQILAVINEKNTNIPKYEDENVRFDAISFLMIKVKNLKKSVQIYKIFALIMPMPLIILFYDNKQTNWVFGLHEKRKDLTLSLKKTFEIGEELNLEHVESKLDFNCLDKTNLKIFYLSWLEALLSLELEKCYGIKKKITVEDNILEKLKKLDSQIFTFSKNAKKEKQMNLSIEWSMKKNKLKAEKALLISKERDIDDE